MTQTERRDVPESLAPDRWAFLLAAWSVALLSTLVVLFVGEVLGQAPCNLCWFQRAMMFPLVIVLGIASFRSDAGVRIYALPLAVVGWLVAAFHSLLYSGIIPEAIEPCGMGPSCSSQDMTISGVPLPALSLAAFTLIILFVLLASRRIPR